jgi:hypothetical protein
VEQPEAEEKTTGRDPSKGIPDRGKAESRLLTDNPITPDRDPHAGSERLDDFVKHEEDKVAVRGDAESDLRRLGSRVTPGSSVSFELRPVGEFNDHDLHHDRTIS